MPQTLKAYRGSLKRFAGNRAEKEPSLPKGYGLMVQSLKQKDRIGFPWRLAFALQADGWYLRMDNIWAKMAPLPESVSDRPTRSHEYVFLFTKNAKYNFDVDAIREPGGRKRRSVWTIQQRANKQHTATFPEELVRLCVMAGCTMGGFVLDPFGGSGTTAKVCKDMGRSCVSIELNENYVEAARSRIFTK
jgi:DNA modification methylase